MPPETRLTLKGALLFLRLSLALYLLLNGLAKIAIPNDAQAALETLYHLNFSFTETTLLGLSQAVLAGMIASGALRALSYGLGFLVQTVGTFARYAALFTPFEADHLVHLAAIPVLAGSALLFALRDEDTILSLDAMAHEPRR
jgi:hypothetical protein